MRLLIAEDLGVYMVLWVDVHITLFGIAYANAATQGAGDAARYLTECCWLRK